MLKINGMKSDFWYFALNLFFGATVGVAAAALTIFSKGSLAFTARGPAHVVQEPMLGVPMFAAVAIDVENIDDHRQREFAVDSGVSLDWINERTQRFLQEHLDALQRVAASGQ